MAGAEKQAVADRLLDTEEAAALLKMSPNTLVFWRIKGYGPRYIKLHPSRKGMIRYRFSDIEVFLKERERR